MNKSKKPRDHLLFQAGDPGQFNETETEYYHKHSTRSSSNSPRSLLRESYNGSHFDFSDAVKKCWIVKRDMCGDEYIALNGKNALGKSGLDHIYLISDQKVGLWISSKQVKQKIKALRRKLPSMIIEQLGENEAVLSVPVKDLHDLCKVVKARRRRRISEQRKQQLRRVSPFLRRKKTLIKTGSNASKITKLRVRA